MAFSDEPDSVEVLHKINFVLRLVVDQFINPRLRDHDAEATRAQPLFLPSAHVIQWVALGMAYRGMAQFLEAEPWAGVECDIATPS